MFNDLEGVCGGIMFAGGFAFREAGNAEVIVTTGVVGAANADLPFTSSARYDDEDASSARAMRGSGTR